LAEELEREGCLAVQFVEGGIMEGLLPLFISRKLFSSYRFSQVSASILPGAFSKGKISS
jgi:hypothetical protein|tara:strand:+ start:142 stop:318 length:177 start_codon:yes stop_codon:yes gene_type:complete